MSSISERIAALQKKTENSGALPPLDAKANKNSSIAERIASLEKAANDSITKDTNSNDIPKPGRLKIPAGSIQIPMMGAHPSLRQKQKEREERNNALREQAQEDETRAAGNDEGGETKKKVGKLKLPPGAVPILPMGCGPPPALWEKQKDRESRGISDRRTNVEEAIMSRPIIEAKRRSPSR
ncbi:hypothetical protein THAOC_34209 [Thalassiosira oceanica]|uniref:Uncharacterized protein n=1 Tax=Thalassiosira oceanica TaxID=159749 RepID=K0RK73_THAOC|nr:hypothetical protein THAOC_34209 [Thalassiosira oceanica]|mmetsp:Transcript_2073/g.4954  ORF Transcript_2073/g.4954 Transcript_2073/m.4954 type:complete len:182 (+) Transcript_2073:162-707(+)|eukprot:EJK47097.1 hypothetical protein THAOC_34209 [Thalassiosira oceanica]